MKRESCRPRSMVSMAQEFLDILFWKLHRILDQEGVSVLQWAIMQRALEHDRGVAFSLILKATRDSKDNVRRAAKSLQDANVGRVIADPSDGRARIFILTKLGRRRTLHVQEAFEAELLASVGAREIFSKRAERFTRHMWHASVYLASGDLAKKEMVDDRKYNRAAIPDNSLRYVELPKRARSPFIDLDIVPF
jgi:DNA-binding MarR family transcriptional regulator